MELINENYIERVFGILNHSQARYVLIKNICDELPNGLIDGKDIDIVVHNDDAEIFEKEMLKYFFSCDHPLGCRGGWQFLYGLKEYQFWKLKDTGDQTVYVDASFALSCKSLMPKKWIPLDRLIQDRLWDKRIWDEKNNWWITDLETRFAYYIVRCIFDKKTFSDKYVLEIEKVVKMIDWNVEEKLLEKIFFKYTHRLIDLLQNKEYKCIIEDYLRFSSY